VNDSPPETGTDGNR